MNKKEIINNTIDKLLIDPDFVVKQATSTGDSLTAREVIELIVNDWGNSKSTDVFKGHCQIKIRKALKLVFFEIPKPTASARIFGHVLAINGLKKCPHCQEVKDVDLFSNNKAMKSSGKDSWCLSCMHTQRAGNKEHLKIIKALWQKNNKQRAAAATARRRARKILAEPKWANFKTIAEIYANCPDGYHVDHWAPLAGENVCGLHVEYNLQYMPANLNISKSNSFDEANEFRFYGPF